MRRGTPTDLNVLFNTGYTAPPVLDSANPSAGMHVMTKSLALDAFVERIGDLLPDDNRDRSY